tara:strand:+ start:2172 stop:3053 length:882 start_codon:yes stop_codon:yes gene_type:complete
MELDPKTDQIFDVDESNFEELVIKESENRVVVVDFWAPWCGPCKTLGPDIEAAVRGLGSGIALAKVNVDENQQLAAMFRVQSIPAVKILHQGKLVQEFTGALPKDQIDELLRPLLPDAPEPDVSPIDEATQRASMGDLDGASEIFKNILEEKPNDGDALIGLARLALQQGDIEAVHEYVNLVELGTPQHNQAHAILAQLEFGQKCHEAGGRNNCAERVSSDPSDPEGHYLLACCQAAEGQFEEALEIWLDLVTKDPGTSDEAAKKAMISVFHLLGRENKMVKDFQRRLYQALN